MPNSVLSLMSQTGMRHGPIVPGMLITLGDMHTATDGDATV